MESRWSDEEASRCVAECLKRYPGRSNADIGQRVYSSRLIGREPRLVLHGGGNTSVKTRLADDLGEMVDVLCVKGSGSELADIDVPGLPAIRLATLGALRRLASLTDEAMVNAARTRLLDADAPNPSVETLLHAFLPQRFIDHSHADAILALVDQADASALCRAVFGERLAIVPYVMPGFALAKLAAEVYEAHPRAEGLLLVQHGLFTFGDTARESYERHIEMVDLAERVLADCRARTRRPSPRDMAPIAYDRLAPLLRGRLGSEGRNYLLELREGAPVREFVDDPGLAGLCGRGPATPDHVIRTKQMPLVLDLVGTPASEWAAIVERGLDDYRRDYLVYFHREVSSRGVERRALDPDPRVVLVPGLGLIGVGATMKAARIAADLYEHTIAIIRDAEAVGTYHALPDADIFDMEYWSLEQAKLAGTRALPLTGRVVMVTGAASGIGEATARRFAAAGASLFLVDRDEAGVAALALELGGQHRRADLRVADEVHDAFDACIRSYGGLDGVVSNAGTAPQAPIAECPPDLLEDSLEINLLAHQRVASRTSTILRVQGRGGFLLFNASKAAFNPGPGFGPYAVAKAALVALMKQYALEGGEHGIRSNAINADRVRTGLLPREVVEERARARGLAPDDYFRANLLRRIVTVEDIAEGFLHLALAESTTGAVLTIDGGNIAASPR